jgi:hypothetical protein
MEWPRDRSAYINLRRRYEPKRIRLVIIAESPSASGLYFYDQTGAPSEPLFAALMKQLDPSQFRRATKEVGLREFQRRGWLLVDATYEPVNKLDRSSAARMIERDYPLLRDDLVTLTPDRSVPLVLIKKNICKVLEPKLTRDGFRVLNRGCLIPFPASGQQKKIPRTIRCDHCERD